MPYIKDENGNYVPAPSIKGADGREILLRVTSSHVQWRYIDTEWENLLSLSAIAGPHGAEVEMRITSDFILQYKLESDLEWTTLFDLSTLTRSVIFQGHEVEGEGAGISASVTGSKAGDMYLNLDTSNVYRASASNVWDYTGRLVASLSTEIDSILMGDGSGGVSAAIEGTDFALIRSYKNVGVLSSSFSTISATSQSFAADGISDTYYVTAKPSSLNGVIHNGTEQWSGYTYEPSTGALTFETTPPYDDTIIVYYSHIDMEEARLIVAGYTKRAAIALSGATATMAPTVILPITQVLLETFATSAISYDGGVYIYAKSVGSNFIIPLIRMVSVKEVS